MSQCKKISLYIYFQYYFVFDSSDLWPGHVLEKVGSSWSPVCLVLGSDPVLSGVWMEMTGLREFMRTQHNFPAKAAEPQRAHNEPRDITGNASQESTYSGTVRAIKHNPTTFTKEAHLHDTERFWSHQNNQNVFFLLPNDIY